MTEVQNDQIHNQCFFRTAFLEAKRSRLQINKKAVLFENTHQRESSRPQGWRLSTGFACWMVVVFHDKSLFVWQRFRRKTRRPWALFRGLCAAPLHWFAEGGWAISDLQTLKHVWVTETRITSIERKPFVFLVCQKRKVDWFDETVPPCRHIFPSPETFCLAFQSRFQTNLEHLKNIKSSVEACEEKRAESAVFHWRNETTTRWKCFCQNTVAWSNQKAQNRRKRLNHPPQPKMERAQKRPQKRRNLPNRESIRRKLRAWLLSITANCWNRTFRLES